MTTKEMLEKDIQKLGGLSNLENLSEKQLIEMYHLHWQLLDLNDAEDPDDFLEYVEWCVPKLNLINRAYNRVVGYEVDLWKQFRKNI